MNNNNILHVFGWDKKFIQPFQNLIHTYFIDGYHRYIIIGNVSECDHSQLHNTIIFRSVRKHFCTLSKELYRADKIVLHGLFFGDLLYLLFLQPWLLKKCYWVIWGGDLYVHDATRKDWRWHKTEFFRRFVIKRIRLLITYIKGDVDLARKWYGAKGLYFECLMYPSNIYTEYDVPQKEHATINILVGNSADPSNNHSEVLEKLLPYKERDIKIIVPLSYGDQLHAREVIKNGYELFGDKFVPLTEFIQFNEYLELLGQIDIAIFNHRRQQAMGNTITLLGLGKKVYIRNDATPWPLFTDLGVQVYDVNNIELSLLPEKLASNNKKIIKTHFSLHRLLLQYKNIFEYGG